MMNDRTANKVILESGAMETIFYVLAQLPVYMFKFLLANPTLGLSP